MKEPWYECDPEWPCDCDDIEPEWDWDEDQEHWYCIGCGKIQ